MEAKICRCCGGRIGARAETNPNICIRCEEDQFQPNEPWVWPNLQNPWHALVNAHWLEQVLDFENSWECYEALQEAEQSMVRRLSAIGRWQ